MKSLSLSERAMQLKPSPTLHIASKALAMKRAGIDVISLAAGEPDFQTPTSISDAAVEALRAGFTKYTATKGIPELREAISEKLKRDNRLSIDPDNVIVSNGAKQSVFNALTVLLDPGDEVILVAPYWMTYADQVQIAGGTVKSVCASAANGFVPQMEDIRSAINDRTKAIIVNSPCNPTGAVWPRSTMKEIAALAIRHNLWIISDEIYERLIYDVEHTSIASLGGDVAQRTITVGGCSKTYAMTGWRIGFAAAPPEVARAMSNFQDQVTSNANSFAQKGAVAAFRLPSPEVEAMRDEYRARRDLILEHLSEIPGTATPVPNGAFYVMPDITKTLCGKCPDDCALAEYLLEEAHVAVVPGSVFDGAGHLRISYAASREQIREGIARIAQAIHKLRP